MVAVPPYSTTKNTVWQELNDGTRQIGPDIPSFLRNRASVIDRATLEITDVNKNDSSTYFFEALTSSDGTLSSAVNLTVTGMSKFSGGWKTFSFMVNFSTFIERTFSNYNKKAAL